MLARGLAELRPPDGSLVFVENVGNLVCPALFDLGEAARVVVVSVTEGEDKPLKYPYMFSVADLVVINKIDLLPHVDVDLERLVAHCRSVNPGVRVLPLSVTTGEGMAAWCDWLLTCEPVPRWTVRLALDSRSSGSVVTRQAAQVDPDPVPAEVRGPAPVRAEQRPREAWRHAIRAHPRGRTRR